MMIVYIVSRSEAGRTAIWPPFANLDKAKRMIDGHVKWRVSHGATLQRTVSFTPAPIQAGTRVRVGGSESNPIMTDAPIIVECCVHEVELIAENQKDRAVYRVCQHIVIE